MKAIKLIVVVTLLTGLLGCASGARMEGMSFYGEPKNYPAALRRNITVTNVSGGEETNPAWTSEIGNEQFMAALIESLRAQTLYSGRGIFNLEVQMIEVEQPMFGLDITVTTKIRYTMKNSTSESTVFDETITASYTATVKDAFAAVKRLRLANEGSAKKNIEALLDKLSRLNI